MKHTKSFLAFTLVILFAFSAVLYTSCSKKSDPCKGVVCYNGGVCVSGGCSCPTGYSGLNCEISRITFDNNSFTTIYMSLNGTSATIPAGGSVVYSGTSGSSAVWSANTSGTYGETVNWGASDLFPTSSNQLTLSLDVSTDYFFLEVINLHSSYANKLYTNFGFPSQLVENVSIPNDGYIYDIGYYSVYSPNSYNNCAVSVDYTGGGYYDSPVFTIPYLRNSYAQVTVH